MIVDSEQVDPWTIALSDPTVMHALVMQSAVTAPLRDALPSWFLESRKPAAAELEEIGVAATSLDQAAKNLVRRYGSRCMHRHAQDAHLEAT